MTYQPLPYAEPDDLRAMRHDARCVEVAILIRYAGTTGVRPSHRDKVKQEISVDEAARRLAEALDPD